MRFWRSWRSRIVGVWLLVVALAATAGDIDVRNAQVVPAEDGYTLSADFGIELGPRLQEAVDKGVSLYFVLDFEATRPRWYWFDEQVASRSQTIRLYYHALTRQYRVASGALHLNFETLDEALRMLSRVRSWQVIDRGQIKVGESYQAAVRIRLDLTQLPKPFQLAALTRSKDWSLDSDWHRWTFSPAEPPR